MVMNLLERRLPFLRRSAGIRVAIKEEPLPPPPLIAAAAAKNAEFDALLPKMTKT